MWENEPLHRKVLLRSQCSQSTASQAQKIGRTESGPRESQSKWLEWSCSSCSPNFNDEASIDRLETSNLILPPIPEVVWQQPRESPLSNIHKLLTTDTQKNAHARIQTEKWCRYTNVANKKNFAPIVWIQYGTILRKSNSEHSSTMPCPITPRNNNLKSSEMKLKWQPMTVEMTTLPLPKY